MNPANASETLLGANPELFGETPTSNVVRFEVWSEIGKGPGLNFVRMLKINLDAPLCRP